MEYFATIRTITVAYGDIPKEFPLSQGERVVSATYIDGFMVVTVVKEGSR